MVSSTMSSVGWIAATPSIATMCSDGWSRPLLLEHDAGRAGRQHLGAEGQRAEHVPVGREQPVGDEESGADVLAGFGLDTADRGQTAARPARGTRSICPSARAGKDCARARSGRSVSAAAAESTTGRSRRTTISSAVSSSTVGDLPLAQLVERRLGQRLAVRDIGRADDCPHLGDRVGDLMVSQCSRRTSRRSCSRLLIAMALRPAFFRR